MNKNERYVACMPKKPIQTPQQKKTHSYAKDRRNSYGENDKASRKAIPARKAQENRKTRRKAKQNLDLSQSQSEEVADITESSLQHDIERVGGWKKEPDIPLEEFLSRKPSKL